MSIPATLFGLAAGVLIGSTGVGAGALMTPLLLGAFRLDVPVAIGTDLWFAALTKGAGAVAHHRQGHVDWRICGLMLAGSLPAALATLGAMHGAGIGRGWYSALGIALGIALLLTAAAIASRQFWHAFALRIEGRLPESLRPALTVALGAALGVLVTLSSVGAGAVGSTVILLLYPRLSAKRLVGTDIAHAVPLTLVAGIGHAALGHVDWPLVFALLLGSVPGIWLGARLTRVLPERLTRVLLSAALLLAGLKIIA
ncbi:MAG: sulfite exporter TauE/SafE family protein [Mycobacterium sp.]|nr:sulfite exporter TauE/SafE family protein [Mycobacterium sp.]